MLLISRRWCLAAAAGTLASGLTVRKSAAAAEPILGDLSGLVLADPPKRLPDVTFEDAGGTEHHLSDFKGRGMVVNLWATWCVPCVAEMPALASLSKELAPSDIAVLPLSSDRGGIPAVERFYREHGIGGLPVLIDPKGAGGRALGVRGIPTTIIIDRNGMERARLEGAADWSRPAAAERVRKLVAV